MSSDRNNLSRRGFLKAAGVAGAGSLLAGAEALAGGKNDSATKTSEPVKAKANASATQPVAGAIPKRVFGKTGVKVPILALGGGMNFLDNQLLLKQAIKLGVTYWDTAYVYENGNSEKGIGKYFATNSKDRKKVFLVSKGRGNKPGELDRQLAESLERLKTDHIDLYYMHAQTSPKCMNDDTKAWAEKAKKSGKIRHFGFSTHKNMAPLMEAAAKAGWIDAIMVTYNWRNMQTDAMKKAVDACAKAKVGICAMKTQAKRWKKDPKDRPEELKLQGHIIDKFTAKGMTPFQARLKAVWQNEKIAVAVSAMKNMTQLKANIAAATDPVKLTQSDLDLLQQYANATCDSYCSQCGQCAEATGLPIPEVMRYMMYYNGYGDKYEARQKFAALSADVRGRLAKADFSGCPNRISIGDAMTEANEILA